MVENGHPFREIDERAVSALQVPRVPFAQREGSSFGVEVITVEELRRRSLDHSIFRPHRIEFHILFLATGGQGRHMVDFEHYPVERGTVIWIAPGQVQRFDPAQGLQGFLVLFQPEVCGLKAPRLRLSTALKSTPGDFELLESLADLIFGLKDRRLSTAPDRLAWRMLAAVLDLWEGAAQRDAPAKALSEEFEAFDTLLEQYFVQRRDVSWYARKLGYSEKTLSRWSRQAVGVGAKAHIDRRVVLEAKRLLVHSDYTVDGIAARLGFSESTNFVKFFKRLEGRTPAAFRASYA